MTQTRATSDAAGAGVLDVGTRLEPLIDDWLIDRLSGGATPRLHRPQPAEVVLVNDQPWEGSACGYYVVLRDGDMFRMYYKAWHIPPTGEQDQPVVIAYAQSRDGVAWEKPGLGLVDHAGSRDNNIVFAGVRGHAHDFSPFIDANPAAFGDARYKAVGLGHEPEGLYAFKSADGLRWSLLQEEPVLTGLPFDTQNIVFWDIALGKYRLYTRDFHDPDRPDLPGEAGARRRDIRTAVSDDMVHWSPPAWLSYPAAPDEQLYTNQMQPYPGAPHLLIGFPARYVDRGWTESTRLLPEPELREQRARTSTRYGTTVTDSLLMTSRDGTRFRRWPEALIRPGLRTRHNWSYGDNYLAWGVLETASTRDDSPPEWSLYATESYFTGDSSRLRRYTARIDGLASVGAPLTGGELLTHPLRFAGEDLLINFATSAGGSLRIELQDAAGQPIAGYTLDDCPEVFGDALRRAVRWAGDRRAGELAGRAVRLRVALRDADLFTVRFSQASS